MSFESLYKTIKVLGEGSYGQVNLVQRLSDGMQFADKTYIHGVDYNEINLLASFEHPNVLHLENIVLDSNENIHVILPLATSDLDATIYGTAIGYTKTVELMYQIISAVAFLNKLGYYHCDIKPQNILMFKNKPVLADFSLSFGDANKIVADTSCGTFTYQDYQTIKDDRFKHKSMRAQFKSKNPNYEQTDVFSLGALLYEMYFSKPLIPFTSNSKTVKEYSELEDKIKDLLKTYKYNRQALNVLHCVQSCTYLDLDKRFNTVQDILSSEMFVENVMTIPIPGKSKTLLQLSNKNWCSINRMHLLTPIVFNWLFSLFRLFDRRFLLTYCTTFANFYRSFDYFSDKKQGQMWGSISFYLATFATSTVAPELDDFSDLANNAFTTEQLEKAMKEYVVSIKGSIRVITIYDITDNGLEIAWWIYKAFGDCKYLEKSPKECHDEYIQLQANNQDLFKYRIQKDLVKSFLRNRNNSWTLQYYNSLEEYIDKKSMQSLTFDFSSNGTPTNFRN